MPEAGLLQQSLEGGACDHVCVLSLMLSLVGNGGPAEAGGYRHVNRGCRAGGQWHCLHDVAARASNRSVLVVREYGLDTEAMPCELDLKEVGVAVGDAVGHAKFHKHSRPCAALEEVVMQVEVLAILGGVA